MTTKMVIAPLAFASLALLFVYKESHLFCVVMALAKFASRLSL